MKELICVTKGKYTAAQKTNYILKNIEKARIFIEWRLVEFGKVFEVELNPDGQNKDVSDAYAYSGKIEEIRNFFKELFRHKFSDPVITANYYSYKSIFISLFENYEASLKNNKEILCQYEKDGQKMVVFFQRPQLKPSESFVFNMFDCILHISIFEDIMRQIKSKYISLQEKEHKNKNLKNFIEVVDFIHNYIRTKSVEERKVYVHFLRLEQMIFDVYFSPSSLCLNCVKVVFEERNELERWAVKGMTRKRLDSMIYKIFNKDEIIRIESKFLKEEIAKNVKMNKKKLSDVTSRVLSEIFVRAFLFYVNNAKALTFIKKHFSEMAHFYNEPFRQFKSLPISYYGRIFFSFYYPIELDDYKKDFIKRFFATLALRLTKDNEEIEKMVESIALKNIMVQLKKDTRYDPEIELEFLLKEKETGSIIISIKAAIVEHFIRYGNDFGVIKHLDLTINIEKDLFELLKQKTYVQEILKVMDIAFPIQPGWEAIEFLSKIVNVAAFVKS